MQRARFPLLLFGSVGFGFAIWACGSFGSEPLPKADGGSNDDAPSSEASSDGSGNDGGGPTRFCPAGGTLFTDDFDRNSNPQGTWSESKTAFGATMKLENTALVVTTAGHFGDGGARTFLEKSFTGKVRRVCASLSVKIEYPVTANAYLDGGRSELVFLAVDLPVGDESFWGLSIDKTGPHLYSEPDTLPAEFFPVAFTTEVQHLMIDVDFTAASAVLSLGSATKTFSNVFDVNSGLPTSPELRIGVQQFPTAPPVKVHYDDVELVVYP